MDFKRIKDGDRITLIPEGMIDTNTAPEFEEEVDSVLSEAGNVIIDFSGVTYISSAGLRILLKAQKKVSSDNGEMVIKNISESIREIFELTGFINILTIE